MLTQWMQDMVFTFSILNQQTVPDLNIQLYWQDKVKCEMWRLKRKHNTQSSNFHLDQVCWRKFLCYEFSNKPKVQKVIMLKYFREWRESLFQRDSRGCHCLHVSMWKGKTVYLTCTSTETMDAVMLNFRKASEESVTQSTSVRTIKQMSLLQSDICVCVRSDYSRAVSP